MWDRLLAIVEEQAQTILRTAFSSSAFRRRVTCRPASSILRGACWRRPSTGTPGHVNSMAQAVGHFLERFPLATMRDGDVYITNDPWLATGHLHDFTVVTPTYLDGEAVALFASTCHVVDIGGRGFGADAKEIFEEGLAIPPLLLARGGELNQTLIEILRANVREPLLVEGDLYSLVACNERGGLRLREMMREFGRRTLAPLDEWIIQTSRDAMLRSIRELPAGTYSHVTHIDGFDSPLTLAAALTIGADGIHVDLTGTSASLRIRHQCPHVIYRRVCELWNPLHRRVAHSQQCGVIEHDRRYGARRLHSQRATAVPRICPRHHGAPDSRSPVGLSP